MDTINGVNLGGWLVLEKWLTPSVFAGTNAEDEYSFMRTTSAKKRIRTHRDTFVTEKDFRWLSERGINLVRIPVGYWLFEPVDGFEPAVVYLDKAMRWAAKHNIRVLIDLHAARGSQNGFDNSGRKGKRGWFESEAYQQETITLLERIATRYKDELALWGIELLNEPLATKQFFILRRFYRQAYKSLRQILQPGTYVVFHDAFQAWRTIGIFWRQGKNVAHPLAIDVHWYVSPVNTKSMNTYLRQSRRLRKAVLRILQLWHPVLVGEWSSVLPQRFFDTKPQAAHTALLSENIVMQQVAHTRALGTIYWNYKAEGGGMWSYRSLVESGITFR